jgi:hypothetical protein
MELDKGLRLDGDWDGARLGGRMAFAPKRVMPRASD